VECAATHGGSLAVRLLLLLLLLPSGLYKLCSGRCAILYSVLQLTYSIPSTQCSLLLLLLLLLPLGLCKLCSNKSAVLQLTYSSPSTQCSP
jgi:hypothetical protein